MSSKTPKANAKKTKWAHRPFFFLIAIVLIALAVLIVNRPQGRTMTDTMYGTQPCITLADESGCRWQLEIAANNASRLQGLSDRDSLEPGHGMLFVFERPAKECFWMKGMRFPIDMIWLNEQREIIKIEQNITPETYPESFCADNTKFVLEVNSGQAEQAGLALGQRLFVIE